MLHLSTKSVQKVMLPILMHLSTMSEVNAGGMAVEVEPSHQYCVIFCYCVAYGSKGAVLQNGV